MNVAGLRHSVLIEPTFDAFREVARALLSANLSPEAVDLADTASGVTESLFAYTPSPTATGVSAVYVPRSFMERAKIVTCHRSASRWNLLHRILFRLQAKRNL